MNTVIQRLFAFRPALAPMLLAAALAASTAARAAEPLADGGSAEVIEVVDGDTVLLASGKQVRLVGIQAPKLPLGRPDFAPWPLADEARAALVELAQGKTLRLSYGGRRLDRHGRLLAHLHDAEGHWIQGALLERGFARVYSFADNTALVAEMLAHERVARDARRGIWGDPYYAVRSATETPQLIDSFQIVEDRVLQVATVRGTTYLNYGAEWRTDFTAVIGSKARRLFTAAGIDPASYEGRRIRVRGWLKSWNGPMIDVTHPEQIELLP